MSSSEIEIPSLYGNQYYKDLLEYRNEALVASRVAGARRSLGLLSLGHVHAMWRTEKNGIAWMTDKGVRVGNIPVWRVFPTTLKLYESHAEEADTQELTTFRLDLDQDGLIETYHSTFRQFDFKELALNALVRRVDRSTGNYMTNEEDRERLYIELARGASGEYIDTSH